MRKFSLFIFVQLFATLFLWANTPLKTEEIFEKTQTISSKEYELFVDGKQIPIYIASQQYQGDAYFFANFDISHKTEIIIKSSHSLEHCTILPERHKFKVKYLSQNKIAFTASKCFHAVVEWKGRRRPLVLFANKPDKNKPDKSNTNILYYGPGRHDVPHILLTSNQTLFLDEGAVVCGAVKAYGENITICGKGILTGDGYKRHHGPGGYLFQAEECRNLVVKDITITQPWSWTAVFTRCKDVTVDNIKVCASNMINDDAIDLCNSSNILIKNCFLRSQDDNIAIKGMHALAKLPCENITIRDCEFWTDKANVFRIGYECDATAMRNIFAKNIDVLHYSIDYRPPTHFWSNTIVWIQPANDMKIENCVFKNFRIHADGLNTILVEAKSCNGTSGPSTKGLPYGRGGVARNIKFQDIQVTGCQGDFTGSIWLEGISDSEYIQNVRFKNIKYFGKFITPKSSCFVKKNFVY